jgi:anti-anti-sigma factor
MARGEHRVTPTIRGGKIDRANSPFLRSALDQAIVNLQGRRSFTLVVDLRNISYMSSSGIKELLGAQKRAKERGGRIILDMVQEHIGDKLRLTGLDNLLPIKENENTQRVT